jgi:hypothetical protein
MFTTSMQSETFQKPPIHSLWLDPMSKPETEHDDKISSLPSTSTRPSVTRIDAQLYILSHGTALSHNANSSPSLLSLLPMFPHQCPSTHTPEVSCMDTQSTNHQKRERETETETEREREREREIAHRVDKCLSHSVLKGPTNIEDKTVPGCL